MLLTSYKTFSAIIASVQDAQKRVANWWWLMSDEEQRQFMGRGVSVAFVAVAAVVILPIIGGRATEQKAAGDFRLTAEVLAERVETRQPASIDSEVAILDHPWMRTVEYALERESDEILTRYGKRYRDLAAVDSFVSFTPAHFSVAERSTQEHLCMATAIYYEARSESIPGQIAVAEVIKNRVRDHRYPDTVCDVVYQGSERTTGCQFSFTCDGSMRRKPRGRTWEMSKTVAMHVMMGLNKPKTGEATHYHTDYVDPVWNKSLIHTKTIGTHIFYRFPQGREWAMVRARQEAAAASTTENRAT